MTELSEKCASEELLNSLTSSLMIFNHCFIILIIFVSFFATVFAVQQLLKHNIFPNGTRILLFSAIVNGVIHQLTVAEIRIKTLFRAMTYSSEPCLIQFQSLECIIENNIYYYTNLFTSFCCISLFFDRLFSFQSNYNKKYKSIISIFLILQTFIPFFILYWIYYGVVYTGYVAMCNYPPGNSGQKFYILNRFRLYILGTFFVLSLVLYFYFRKKEKQMIHKVYDTESRYETYENLLSTQIVCGIVAIQAACLIITATGTEKIHTWTDIFPTRLATPLTGFMTGLTYSNFFLPIIIWYQTNRIIKRRHVTIEKVLTGEVKFSEHFASLDLVWQRNKSVN